MASDSEEDPEKLQDMFVISPPLSPSEVVISADFSNDDESSVEEITRSFAPPTSSSKLPDLLPQEFLDSDSEDDEDVQMKERVENTQEVKKAKKKLRLKEKKAKDRRKGSTVFRVQEGSRDTGLAPKAEVNARATKEAWLQGRQGKNGGLVRKPLNGGFLKKK